MSSQYAYNYNNLPLRENEYEELKIYKHHKKKKAKRYIMTETAKTRILCIAVAVFVMIVMIRYAVISDLNSKNKILSEELKSITAQNQQAMVHINSTTDLSAVEQIAKEELGMNKPSGNQVVKLSLDMSNRSVKPQKQQSEFVKNGKKVFTALLEYLY